MFTELCIGYQTITDSIHVHVLSHIHFRILLDYKCSTWYLTSMAERSKALTFLTWTGVVWVRIPLETYFHFEFSHPPRSEQVSGAHVNEIKHDHSPLVIVDLDSRWDLSYKALYIHTCSIALMSINQMTIRISLYCMKFGTNFFIKMCKRLCKHLQQEENLFSTRNPKKRNNLQVEGDHSTSRRRRRGQSLSLAFYLQAYAIV